MIDLRHDGAGNQQLRPIGGPWSMFGRMRMLAGGHMLEDIVMYNRFMKCLACSMLHIAKRLIMAKAFQILGIVI